MNETKVADKANAIIEKLYSNSNNKRNEKNALKGKTSLKEKITSKEHSLITLGLYSKLNKEERECVDGKENDEIRYKILQKIYNMIIASEKGEGDKEVYIGYTVTGKDILKEYLDGCKDRKKSESKWKKVLAFSKIFINQERQKCGKK